MVLAIFQYASRLTLMFWTVFTYVHRCTHFTRHLPVRLTLYTPGIWDLTTMQCNADNVLVAPQIPTYVDVVRDMDGSGDATWDP